MLVATVREIMREQSNANEGECLAVWCEGDDWCAITCTMNLIDNKWHPVIVDRLLKTDSLRFSELSEEVNGITNKTLSKSLENLEEKGLIERTVEGSKPVEVSYSLTERGRSLEPVIDTLREWGKENLQPAESADNSVC